jgi:hypothetical protein
MRKSFTAVVLVIGMALGSVLTLALNPVGAASALVGASAPAANSHQSLVSQALSTLVGNGTITQKQSDAISSQVQADRAAFWAKRPPIGRQDLTKVAFLLGLDAKTLRADLRSGQTIAQVATAKGINPSTLAGQIVALLEKGIDARVGAHHLSQANASSMKSDLAARVNAFLNRSWGRKLAARHAGGSAKPATSSPTTTGPSTTAPPTTAGSSTTSTAATAAPTSSGSTSTTVKH